MLISNINGDARVTSGLGSLTNVRMDKTTCLGYLTDTLLIHGISSSSYEIDTCGSVPI